MVTCCGVVPRRAGEALERRGERAEVRQPETLKAATCIWRQRRARVAAGGVEAWDRRI